MAFMMIFMISMPWGANASAHRCKPQYVEKFQCRTIDGLCPPITCLYRKIRSKALFIELSLDLSHFTYTIEVLRSRESHGRKYHYCELFLTTRETCRYYNDLLFYPVPLPSFDLIQQLISAIIRWCSIAMIVLNCCGKEWHARLCHLKKTHILFFVAAIQLIPIRSPFHGGFVDYSNSSRSSFKAGMSGFGVLECKQR